MGFHKTSRQTPISVSTPNNNCYYVTSIGVIIFKCVQYIKNYFFYFIFIFLFFSTLGQFDIGYNMENDISEERICFLKVLP